MVKVTIEVLLLIHLISAYPMGVNPANQFMEQLIGIQPGWTSLTVVEVFSGSVIKRAGFRTFVLVLQLFVAETLPTFSGLMQVKSFVIYMLSSLWPLCLLLALPLFFHLSSTCS